MIHLLRHSTFCLWITILVGGLFSLWGLPPLQPIVGFDILPLLMATWLAVLFAAIAWAANRIGLARVRWLMRSAELADQDGLRNEAEESYRNALAILDSFWVAPAARRRIMPQLAARVARFYLSQTRLSAAGEDFIIGYLSAYPNDEEVAEQWVRHAEGQGGLREEHQDLAYRLGNAHPQNEAVQEGLARLFVMLERTDYFALQCYRRVCEGKGGGSTDFGHNLARLLQQDGRSDEWAQQIYRQASIPPPAHAGPLPEVYPDLGRLRIQSAPEPDAEASETLSATHAGEAFRMSSENAEPEEDDEEGRPYLLTRQGAGRCAAFVRGLQEMASAAGRQIAEGLRWIASSGHTAARGLFRLRRARMALLGVLVIGVAAGGLWIATRRTGVIPPAPDAAPTAEPTAATPPIVTDPYTLQVAAYLKQEYALKFVQELKEHGLDAYYIETQSGGKHWYQVRISHFPDQQSAREIGRNLKRKGLVDDFYVTNYVR